MVVYVECLPAVKPWDVVFATRRSSGVAPRACVHACAGAAESLHTYIHTHHRETSTVATRMIEVGCPQDWGTRPRFRFLQCR